MTMMRRREFLGAALGAGAIVLVGKPAWAGRKATAKPGTVLARTVIPIPTVLAGGGGGGSGMYSNTYSNTY